MGNTRKHVWALFELAHGLNALRSGPAIDEGRVGRSRQLKERTMSNLMPVRVGTVEFGKYRTWTRRGKCRIELLLGNMVWQGSDGVGAVDPWRMANVAAHEDECGRRGACEAAYVPDCVARTVEQVEGAVAKEVDGAERAYFQVGFREVDLANLATPVE